MRYLLTSILIFSMVFVSFFADARLLRFGGRATISNNSATILLMVPDSLLGNGLLVLPNGNLPTIDEAIMESGSERSYTIPQECFTSLADQEQLDRFEAENEPCEWEFKEGEDLSMLGYMDHYIANALDQIVTWSIVSPTYSKTFSNLNTTFAQGDGSVKDFSFSAQAPDDLLAGEYEVFATTSQKAISGYSFFEYDFVTPVTCDVMLNDTNWTNVCIQPGRVIGETYSLTSRATKLTVTAASAPAVFSLLAISIFILIRRRFK